jgi:hypothetical protein
MSHFFSSQNTSDFSGMAIIPLDAHDEFELTGYSDSPVKIRRSFLDRPAAVLLKAKTDHGADVFALLTPAEAQHQVRINGSPVLAGIRILQDRDEVVVRNCEGGSHRLYFSDEKIARIEQLKEQDHTVSCARCTKQINPGDQTVTCPACNAVHHQSDELKCWTYADKCANSMCYQHTEITSDFRWVP